MAQATYTWKLTAFERQGNLWVEFDSDAQFRAQQGQVSVYNNPFPPNPQDDRAAWTWDNPGVSPWNTNLHWGSDWYCAWIAQAPPNEGYVYAVQLVTTGGSDPESKFSE
jgi:hypothetical protein